MFARLLWIGLVVVKKERPPPVFFHWRVFDLLLPLLRAASNLMPPDLNTNRRFAHRGWWWWQWLRCGAQTREDTKRRSALLAATKRRASVAFRLLDSLFPCAPPPLNRPRSIHEAHPKCSNRSKSAEARSSCSLAVAIVTQIEAILSATCVDSLFDSELGVASVASTIIPTSQPPDPYHIWGSGEGRAFCSCRRVARRLPPSRDPIGSAAVVLTRDAPSSSSTAALS